MLGSLWRVITVDNFVVLPLIQSLYNAVRVVGVFTVTCTVGFVCCYLLIAFINLHCFRKLHLCYAVVTCEINLF